MDSPFQDILHTNLVPSDWECQRIRDLLADPQREVDHLTEELARLDSLREEISAKRRHLQQFIDAHRAMLAPMRRLPQDTLRGIFMACLSSTRNPAISSAEAPLLLCLICQSWRSIALAMPRLWASIHIVVPNRLRLQHIVDRVAVWLKRSGAVPLDISMVLSRTCGDDWDISPLLSSLVAVSRRWRTIEIPLPEDVSPLLFVVVPLLQTVKIIRWDQSTASASSCSSFAFLAAQGLRSLTIPASQYSHETSVPWKFLTHLEISVSNDYLTCTAAS
ncbi:hypothetical protein B0H14DRAFT_829473 [Mycena olivaceomarginata]|nr:hypothetical protein B0H14DRAFT_829473 [Mycena olivaceomarginata]